MKIKLFFTLLAFAFFGAACGPVSQFFSQSAPTADTQSSPAAQWQLASFTTGGQDVPALTSNPITLQFDPASKLSGSTGCNSYSATYSVQNSNIAISDIGITKKACAAPEAAQQEQRFLQALSSTGSYQVSDGKLIISYNSSDKLTFVASSTSAQPSGTSVAVSGNASATLAIPANPPSAPAVSWKRQHFGTKWNVAFPGDWTVNDDAAQDGTVSLKGPYGAYTYEIGLSYPVGVDAATLDTWVQQQVEAVPEADRGNIKVSDITVAGGQAKLVLDMPTASNTQRTHNVYIWKVGDVNQRLIVIAQTDEQPFDGQAMAKLLDDFLFQIH